MPSLRTVVVRLACLCALLLVLTPRLGAIAGLEGTFEFGLDAPWRMEPKKNADGTIDYGAIPIQLTIQDAQHARFDNAAYALVLHGDTFVKKRFLLPRSVLSLGKFRSVRVKELGPVATTSVEFPLDSLYEVEVNDDWPFPPDPNNRTLPPHTYAISRIWNGENPERLRNVARWSEWHASLWYVPRNKTPGTTIALQIEVILERNPWPPQLDAALPRPGSRFVHLRNYARVHLAKEPLPRFDNQWLYGDFHYHSQGTDNEGESAYNYRGVIRAMGAMGMDFVFATDHASSSEQIVDVDLDIDLLEELGGGILGFLGLPGGDTGDSLEESDAKIPFPGFLRDMDAARFSHAHGLIYDEKGANREASFRAAGFPQNYKSYGVVPQIFLGGEVDAIPEIPRSTIGEPPPRPTIPSFANLLAWKKKLDAWPASLPYGNSQLFNLQHMRDGGVEGAYQLFEPVDDVYLVRDFQGLASYEFYARAHLVYFPERSQLNVDGGISFIPSRTSRFGGAMRRLNATHRDRAALLPEIERKGVAFVAHHLNACGTCSNGPDGVPWTRRHMLRIAFRSPAILGLQFWNEDTRYRSRICSHAFCRDHGFPGQELGYERAENPSVFGVVPKEVRDVGLPLEEYRHGFLAPGVHDHVFELKPFDVLTGKWTEETEETLRQLHHGAADWDAMNLLGLDVARLTDLPWLPPGEPRRMFMGGGSDAHGDLNYRRSGYFLGTEDVTDTAIGKPRNLVFVGAPQGEEIFRQEPGLLHAVAGAQIPNAAPPGVVSIRGHTHEQVVRAVRNGHFSVTDGPALRIAIDLNGNGRIDPTDVQMGDSFSFDKHQQQVFTSQLPVRVKRATLLVEVVSTSEFGPITKIDVYVGVHPGDAVPGPFAAPEARVYAPEQQGVRSRSDPSGVGPELGGFHTRLSDGYWEDNRLRVIPPDGTERFLATFVLELDTFEAGRGVSADRFFVRAFAATLGHAASFRPNRYAFSNPIWLHRGAKDLLLEPGS